MPGGASKPGRKQQQYDPAIDACLTVILDEQPQDKELLLFLLCRPESLDQYVVCPSFQVEQQRSLAVHFPSALASLKDAYLACAITLKQLQSGTKSDMNASVSLGYITKAMSTLHSISISSSQDVALCHALGGALAFSIYSAVGVGVPDICRYCLGTTRPFMDTGISGAHDDPWENFLIMLDTMDCLVHRLNPIRQIQVPAKGFAVDRHLGLCLPLMPYYYDLCVISNLLLKTTEVNDLDSLHKQLDDIHAAVEAWQPSNSEQLIKQFSGPAEIVNLLAQAKAYRLGALLMVHRLRFPFGQEDARAEIWSKEVLMELQMAKLVTNMQMRFVTLPFIVAAVEVQEKSLRVKTLQQVDDCVDRFAPSMQNVTKTFLTRVWHERDLNITKRWFDSVHKPCPVLDSIDTTCFNNQVAGEAENFSSQFGKLGRDLSGQIF